MPRYEIISIDNWDFAEGGSPMSCGEFDTAEAAIARAQELVDGALLQHFGSASDAEHLMSYYAIFGDQVPTIYGEPKVDFDVYAYAERKAREMFAAPKAE